jgi:dihydropteroate synthase
MNFFIPSICLRGKILVFDKPVLMGIINLTDDSFYAGSRINSIDGALMKAEEMMKEGAAIVDLGPTSTRPGAQLSLASDELKKLIPVIRKIRVELPELLISVDTYHASVVEEVAKAGADIINDISGGNFDEKMIATVGRLKIPYVLMHIKGKPENMQENPEYTDVVKETFHYFSEKIQQLHKAGVNDIIIDPGFGFGKTLEHNYELFNAFDLFHQFQLPILAGISRKSMINKVIHTTSEQALNGSTVLHTLALQRGAHILRVHDVKEARQAADILNFAKNIE